MNYREHLKNKNRIVVKIGSSSLTHPETGRLNLDRMEKLVRVLTNINNQGKDVILVSSGSIAVGRTALSLKEKPSTLTMKQACAAVGQARLMMVYQKLFAEYNQICAQILMTKDTMINDCSRTNARNTFDKLLEMNVIPIVNANDTVSTEELNFSDNDTLSSIVTALVDGDLLIILSDIDGFCTDDPNKNSKAKLISCVENINDDMFDMAKASTGADVGTGGMKTKIFAGKIVTSFGADMVICNGNDVENINYILDGKEIGTLFKYNKNGDFNLLDYISPNNKTY